VTDIDAEYVLEQHAYAKDLYTGARAQADEVEELFKSDWEIPKDSPGNKHGASPDIRKPARARAIVEKFLSMLSLRSTQTIQVVPRSLDEDELEATSKLERWARGYQLGLMLETNGNPWRDAAYWFFLRGRGCLETRFDASYLNTQKLAVRTLADDPNNIFSVKGHDGIEWYTKSYKRSVRSLKAEIGRRGKAGKKNRWEVVDLGETDDNAEVELVEFWDDTHCAAVLCGEEGGDAKLLYVKKHDYGFVPLAEARCMATPLADAEWASQPVLYSIMDSLKGMYKLASKMATGVDLFFWPKILVETQSGQLSVLDSGAPGVEAVITPGSKVTVINPTPNQAMIAQLMGWYSGDVQLGGIPDIAWGTEPGNLQSGFAVSQVLAQVMDKIAPHQQALELALGWDWSNKFRVIEQYGGIKGAYLSVPVERAHAKADGLRNPYG
jgi:hypothetical protein